MTATERFQEVLNAAARRKRKGVTLIAMVGVMSIMIIFFFCGIFFLDTTYHTIRNRTRRAGVVASEVTDTLVNQMNLYATRVHQFRREGNDAARQAAHDRWFSRAEIEARDSTRPLSNNPLLTVRGATYTYGEISDRFRPFGGLAFDSLDKALLRLIGVENFDFTILEEGRTYDEENFMVAGQMRVTLEMAPNAWIFPVARGQRAVRQRGNTLGTQVNSSEIWARNGVNILVSMQVDSGRNFWVGNWIE